MSCKNCDKFKNKFELTEMMKKIAIHGKNMLVKRIMLVKIRGQFLLGLPY